MAFPEAGVARLLADCKRHCCVCLRWCGSRIQLHHIVPQAQGGPDDIDNAIPVCLDCHAEIESRSNMGRHFSPSELHEHKRRWLEICRDRPDVLMQANRHNSATGPLEAVLAELEYNQVLVTGEDYHQEYATPQASQFDRAIAANAMESLEPAVRAELFKPYKSVGETADMIRSRLAQTPNGNGYNVLSNRIRERRVRLRHELSSASRALRHALGVADRTEPA